MSIVQAARELLTRRQHEEEKARIDLREKEKQKGLEMTGARINTLKLMDELADIPKVQLFFGKDGVNPIVRIERYDLKKPTGYFYLHMAWGSKAIGEETIILYTIADHRHRPILEAFSPEDFREKLVVFVAENLLEP